MLLLRSGGSHSSSTTSRASCHFTLHRTAVSSPLQVPAPLKPNLKSSPASLPPRPKTERRWFGDCVSCLFPLPFLPCRYIISPPSPNAASELQVTPSIHQPSSSRRVPHPSSLHCICISFCTASITAASPPVFRLECHHSPATPFRPSNTFPVAVAPRQPLASKVASSAGLLGLDFVLPQGSSCLVSYYYTSTHRPRFALFPSHYLLHPLPPTSPASAVAILASVLTRPMLAP